MVNLNVSLMGCDARVPACILKSLSGYTHPRFMCVTLKIVANSLNTIDTLQNVAKHCTILSNN